MAKYDVYVELQKRFQAIEFLQDAINHMFRSFNKCPYCGYDWPEHVVTLADNVYNRSGRLDKMGCTLMSALGVLLKLKDYPAGMVSFTEEEISSMRVFARQFMGWEFGPEFFGMFFEENCMAS